MDCQINRTDDIAEAVLIGRLDSAWTDYLSERLDEVIRTGVREIHLDMSGVSYLSSNGIALLVKYHRQMRQIGGSFRIVADSEAVGHVLKLTGLAKLFRDEGVIADSAATGPAPGVTVDHARMTLQVFKKPGNAGLASLKLIGDPAKLAHGGYCAGDDRSWPAAPAGV